MTWILQKNSGYDGPLTLNDTLSSGFWRIFAAKIPPIARRAQRMFRQHGFCSAGFPAASSRQVRFADSDGVHRTPEIGDGGATNFPSPSRFGAFLRLQSIAGCSIVMRARSSILSPEQQRSHGSSNRSAQAMGSNHWVGK